MKLSRVIDRAFSTTPRWGAWFAAALGCLLVGATVQAAGGDIDDRVERTRIRNERAAANTRFLDRERECRTRFVVTACVNEARRDQRETLARLRSEESVLDDAQRKQRAAQRMDTIREKLDKGDAKEREAGNVEQREAHRKATEPRVTVRSAGRAASEPRRSVPSPARAASAGKPVVSAEDRRAEEARSRAAFDARNEAAQEHREMVEKRNAERAAKRKRVAPLPSPAASSP